MIPTARTIALLLGATACGSASTVSQTSPRPAAAPAGQPAAVPTPAPAAADASSSAFAGPATPADGTLLPGAFSRHHLFLRATVGGVPALLLFDSGASATILSPRLVQRLGLAYRGRHVAFGIGEPVTSASAYDGPEIRIGSVQLRPRIVLSWANAAFPMYGPSAPDGVIGFDLLRSFVVHVDALAGRIVAFDTSAPPPLSTRRGARVVALHVRNGLPVVDAEVFVAAATPAMSSAHVVVPVIVDYGAGAGLQLSRRAAERLGFPMRLRDSRPRQLIGIGGTVEVPEGIADSVRIAGAAIPEAVVAADTTETSSVELADAEGFVGTELLRRFAVTLDYARGRAVFEPNALLRAPFCRNAAGICVRAETSMRGAQVVFVDPGSAGARAGIRPGYLILAVDGASVAQLSAIEVDRLLERGPGPVLEVVRTTAQLRALVRPESGQRGGPGRRAATRERVSDTIRLPAP